jgi:hypothetical protein
MAACIIDRDRRQVRLVPRAMLREQLNDDQRMTLSELERFGWELKFVRRPLFQDAIPVVIDGDRKAFSVLKADGSLDDHPSLKLRD